MNIFLPLHDVLFHLLKYELSDCRKLQIHWELGTISFCLKERCDTGFSIETLPSSPHFSIKAGKGCGEYRWTFTPSGRFLHCWRDQIRFPLSLASVFLDKYPGDKKWSSPKFNKCILNVYYVIARCLAGCCRYKWPYFWGLGAQETGNKQVKWLR